MNKKVLIAGGTGFVGRNLEHLLLKSGAEVFILTSKREKLLNDHCIFWNPSKHEIELNSNSNFDVVINLAGENIGSHYWTKARKLSIVESRVNATLFLKELINNDIIKADFFIQTSAIGFYGNRGVIKLDESSALGSGFLASCCQFWEASIEGLNCEYSILRLGVVFDKKEGAFPKLVQGIKYHLSIILGDGSNHVSWISIEDLTRLILYVIENKQAGVINAVSPNPIQSKEIVIDYSKYINKNLLLKLFMPNFIVKTIFGEMSELFLNSQNVSADKISNLKFEFKHKFLIDFLNSTLSN